MSTLRSIALASTLFGLMSSTGLVRPFIGFGPLGQMVGTGSWARMNFTRWPGSSAGTKIGL